jgi:hypothetical protein
MDIEQRLVALEAKVEIMEARRAALLPPELLDDANLQQLVREASKAMVVRWKQSLAEHGVQMAQARLNEAMGISMAQARLNEAIRKLADSQKLKDQKLAAEIAAAILHFERTGESPEGYEITG